MPNPLALTVNTKNQQGIYLLVQGTFGLGQEGGLKIADKHVFLKENNNAQFKGKTVTYLLRFFLASDGTYVLQDDAAKVSMSGKFGRRPSGPDMVFSGFPNDWNLPVAPVGK